MFLGEMDSNPRSPSAARPLAPRPATECGATFAARPPGSGGRESLKRRGDVKGLTLVSERLRDTSASSSSLRLVEARVPILIDLSAWCDGVMSLRVLQRALRRMSDLEISVNKIFKEASVSGSTGRLVWRNIPGLAIVFAMLVAFLVSALIKPDETALAAGTANDGPGVAASWTTGNKLAVGTSAETTSKVWFTAANGITSEVFYPRLDVPNVQDMQYTVTDGSTFVDLERDATKHEISTPDEKALEYTVTNSDKRAAPKYRITNTYITDPIRNALLIRTRFQSLDGNSYRIYLLENPSMAGGGANDNAWWDGANSALMSSGTETLFGSSMTVVSALRVASPNDFVAHENGYSGAVSDCLVELRDKEVLKNQFDNVANNGNVV
jgi:hypothetical protein